MEESPSSPPSSSRKLDVLWFVLALLGCIGTMVVYHCVDLIPTHDGPRTAWAAWARAHLDDPASGWGQFVTEGSPVTSQGFSIPFRALGSILPWRLAHQLTLSLIALIGATGYLAVARKISPERAFLGLLAFVWIAPWALYMGFFSFLAGMAFTWWVLLLALDDLDKPWSSERTMAIAALIAIQSFAHVFTAQVTLVALLCLLASRHQFWQKDQFKAWALRLFVASLPALVTTFRAAQGASEMAARVTDLQVPYGTQIYLIDDVFIGGPAWRKHLALALTLTGLIASITHRLRTGRFRFPAEPSILAAGAIVFAMGLLFPLNLASWHYLSPRPLALGMPLLLLLLPVGTSPRIRLVTLFAITIFVGSSLAWSANYNQRLAQQCGDVLAGIDAPIRRDGARLSLPIDSSKECRLTMWRFASPMQSMAQYYTLQQGGALPNSFVISPQIHEVLIRNPDPFPRVPAPKFMEALSDGTVSPEERQGLLGFLASAGSPYQDVILFALPDDASAFLSRGYRVDWNQGRAFIAHFEGCSTQVHLEGEHGAGKLEIGPLPGPIAQVKLPVQPGDRILKADRTICGPVWIRFRGADQQRCSGSDNTGRVTFADRKKDEPLTCSFK